MHQCIQTYIYIQFINYCWLIMVASFCLWILSHLFWQATIDRQYTVSSTCSWVLHHGIYFPTSSINFWYLQVHISGVKKNKCNDTALLNYFDVEIFFKIALRWTSSCHVISRVHDFVIIELFKFQKEAVL